MTIEDLLGVILFLWAFNSGLMAIMFGILLDALEKRK